MDVVSLAAEFPNDNPALHSGVSWVCLDVIGAPVAVDAPSHAAAAPPESVPEARHADESVPSMSVVEILAAEPLSEPVPELAEEDVPPARLSGIVGLGETPRDESEQDLSAAADEEEPIVVEDLPPLDETVALEGFAFSHPEAPTAVLTPPPSIDPWTILLATLADVAIGAGSPHVASVLPALLLGGTIEAMPDDAMQSLAEANVVRSNEVTSAFLAQTRAWRGILLGTGDDFAACGNAMLDEWAADLLSRLLGAPSRATALKRELRSRGVAGFGLVEAA